MAGIANKCPCLRPKIEDEVRVLDYKHLSLYDVPSEVFNKERTLEELYIDSNQIRDLPRELFFCLGLRKLSISDNEITNIPPAISSLTNLEELDFSKNGIIEVPDNIKGCKYLRSIDASVNPLGKLPEGFTFLANLTHLYLSDTCLDYLPGSIGRMVKLKILEMRENHLKTLPHSFSRLVALERLDIGNNQFTELSDVIGGLSNLLELWCDNNQITTITRSIGKLKHLMFLDASNNRLQEIPKEIDGCVSLADLHLTSNNLMELPDRIGNLNNLITLKVDDNQLVYLPKTLGGLSALSELNVSVNDLEDLPASMGLLRNLRTFYADENLLQFLPAEIGSCSGITVLSLRCNKLTYIPDELGRIPRLRVLNLSDNFLHYLPFSIVKLKELQALWLSENQTRPLIPLQSEYEDSTGRKILTCYLLPQGELKNSDEKDHTGDNESFHPSMWDEERLRKQQIHFAFADGSDEEGTLVRCPTPHPKEMRQKGRHARSLTMKHIINGEDMTTDGSVDRTGVTYHNPRTEEVLDETHQQGFGYSKMLEHSDMRDREAWVKKPTSPKLQESHRLYRYDKEKLLKDKARMQHRLSVPDFESNQNGFLKDATNKVKKVKPEESRMRGRSGSVPDLTSGNGKEASATRVSGASTVLASPEYDDLYYKQIDYRHKRRRSNKLREYDSDTDFRNNHESRRFRREVRDDSSQDTNIEILSVQSQPLPHHYFHQHQYSDRRRETSGCASDLEVYSGRGSFPTANAAAAAFQKKYQQGQYPAYKKNYAATQLRAHTPDSFQNSRPNSSFKTESFKFDDASDCISQHSRSSEFKESSRPRSDYSINSNRTNNQNVPDNTNNLAYNDEMYKHPSISGYNPTFHAKTSNTADVSSNKHSLSKQNSSGPVQANNSETSFQTRVTLGPTIQIPLCSEPAQQTLPSQSAFNEGHPPSIAGRPNINNLNGSNLSFQHSSHTASPSPPACQKNSFEKLSTPVLSQAPLAVAEASFSLGSAAVKDCKGSKLCTVLEERAVSQQSLHSDHSIQPRQSPAVPPPYNPAPPYRRPSDNTRSRSNRSSSDSSSIYSDSPRGATNMHSSPVEESNVVSSSAIQNLIVSQSQSSPCGFHGSNPYPDLPAASRERLSFTDYADIDRRGQNHYYSSGSCRPHGDTQTCRSGSSSSQIGSASQTRSVYLPGEGSGEHSRSDSPDSQCDIDNQSFSLVSSSRQGRPHDRYTSSLDTGNYDELSTIPNQEQSSQVSSSTDSGYSHGHHVYELIGDHSKISNEQYTPQEAPGYDRLQKTSAVTFQRQTPVKGSGSIHSRDHTPVRDFLVKTSDSTTQEHKEQLRVTIKKNPGLGFSIAGGIGSHGNPFRAKDIGIFVTKVIPEGPASKFLRPGDKILEVNKVDFQVIEHNQAVAVLKKTNIVTLLIERVHKVNMV